MEGGLRRASDLLYPRSFGRVSHLAECESDLGSPKSVVGWSRNQQLAAFGERRA